MGVNEELVESHWIDGAAWLSADRAYRYTLRRRGWLVDGENANATLVWVMLNPSSADEATDDPTIRRVVRFTQREGYRSALVVNLFALRATNPKTLRTHPDPVGPFNDQVLTDIACDETCDIVCAWGAYGDRFDRAGKVLAGALAGRELMCLGTTKSGHPRHPLYVPATQPLQPYRSAD